MHLFDINGPLMDALRKLSDIVLYNLLFILFSLPIVTAGAAMAALTEGMQQLAEQGYLTEGVWKGFLQSFRKHFKEATKLHLLILCLGVVVFAALKSLSLMPEAMADFYLISVCVIIGLCGFGFQYVYSLLIRREMSWKEAIKTSFLLGIAKLPWTLLSLGVMVGFIYITLFMRDNAFYYGTFYWIVAGFGILIYINSFFFLKAYKGVYGE